MLKLYSLTQIMNWLQKHINNMISSSIIVISGIVIVLAVTIFFGFIFNTMYNNLTIEHWLPQTIIV